ELERMNSELSTFAYVASHDLQEPLRKIQTFANRIVETEAANLSPAGSDYLRRMHKSVFRVHNLLEDLLIYSRLNTTDKKFEEIDLNFVLQEEQDELKELITEKQAHIVSGSLPRIKAIPFQVRQLFHNLLTNSLKFSVANRDPSIVISSRLTDR